jgi:hypothetical protein
MHKIATYQSEGSSAGEMRSRSVAGECVAVRLEGGQYSKKEWYVQCRVCRRVLFNRDNFSLVWM